MITESTCSVSVVVPTFQRPDLLMRCLAALMAQDFDPAAYEVIIVDDAACDETRRAVESWCSGRYTFVYDQEEPACSYSGPSVRYLPVRGTHGPAAARNAGWRVARGELIAFTDDDCIPAPGWLKAGTAAFTDGVTGAYGQLIVPLQGIPTDYERNAAQLATATFVTANCFYRRACLASVGGFDESFTAAWREDSDLFFTLQQHYRGFAFAPSAVVVHPLRPARWGISLSQQRKSMFNALLYKKHPVLYRQQIQSTPPWRYYGIVGALLAFMGGVLGRNQRLTFAAACLWMFLTGRFCLQRLGQTSRNRRHVAEMLVTSLLIPPLALFWRIRGAIRFRVFFL